MSIFNKKMLKEIFKKKGFKIGNVAVEKFMKMNEELILDKIIQIIRETKLSGRKVVREEDFE